jgi:hypothetical protein
MLSKVHVCLNPHLAHRNPSFSRAIEDGNSTETANTAGPVGREGSKGVFPGLTLNQYDAQTDDNASSLLEEIDGSGSRSTRVDDIVDDESALSGDPLDQHRIQIQLFVRSGTGDGVNRHGQFVAIQNLREFPKAT